MGEALVNPENGFVRVFAINSTSEDTELTLPPIELEGFNIVNLEKQSLNKNDPFSKKLLLMLGRRKDSFTWNRKQFSIPIPFTNRQIRKY